MDSIFERLACHPNVAAKEENECSTVLQLNNGASIFYRNKGNYYSKDRELTVQLCTGELALSIGPERTQDGHVHDSVLFISLKGLPYTLPDTSEAPQVFSMIFDALKVVVTKMVIQKTKADNIEIEG